MKLSEIYLREENKLQEAEKYVKLALEIDPNLPEALITLGRIQEKNGFEDMAMNNYKLGIKAKINSKLGVLAQFQLGCIHERRKEFK